MLKESKDPKIIWKCIHSLNPSNHIRPHRLDIKVDKTIDIANTFIRILGPMISVPVDLFMSRFKRSCGNSFIFTGV
jgi:hypothetical protein